ncbi:MAG: DUF4278 domain-containing protein [Pseudomonadota bacterium]
MTKLIYRGQQHDGQSNVSENQNGMFIGGRPQLVYRGVAHNGIRPTENTGTRVNPTALIYRGFRTA